MLKCPCLSRTSLLAALIILLSMVVLPNLAQSQVIRVNELAYQCQPTSSSTAALSLRNTTKRVLTINLPRGLTAISTRQARTKPEAMFYILKGLKLSLAPGEQQTVTLPIALIANNLNSIDKMTSYKYDFFFDDKLCDESEAVNRVLAACDKKQISDPVLAVQYTVYRQRLGQQKAGQLLHSQVGGEKLAATLSQLSKAGLIETRPVAVGTKPSSNHTANGTQAIGLSPVEPVTKPAAKLWTNFNIAAVDNNPTRPTKFSSKSRLLITKITTYHWNYGRGKKGGTISLVSSKGKTYGPWKVVTTSGSGASNVYWTCNPNVVLPPDTYTVVDSHPATWSQNAQSKHRGLVELYGNKLP